MTKTTLATLRAKARRLGCSVEDDEVAGVIRVEAPLGKCFEWDFHEILYWYDGDKAFRREAIEDAVKDSEEWRVTSCEIENCEWCNSRDED